MNKSFHIAILITLATVTTFLAGCEKETDRIANFTMSDKSSQSFIKINYASAYQKNPVVQLKINDKRVSSNISYSYPFPGGGLGTNGGSDPLYFPIAPGSVKVGVATPAVGTANDSVQIFSGSINAEVGKFYTYHIADTGANTQTLLLEENIAMPDPGTSRFRFVNLIPNLAAIDLYYGTTLVAANVAYKSASPSFVMPNTTAAAPFSIRKAGDPVSATPIALYVSTGSTTYAIPYGRVMTVFARGYSTVTSTSDPRRALLSLFFVQ